GRRGLCSHGESLMRKDFGVGPCRLNPFSMDRPDFPNLHRPDAIPEPIQTAWRVCFDDSHTANRPQMLSDGLDSRLEGLSNSWSCQCERIFSNQERCGTWGFWSGI